MGRRGIRGEAAAGLALLSALSCTTGGGAAAGPRVSATIAERSIPFSEGDQLDLADRIRRSVTTCQFNSASYPDAAWVDDPTAAWAAVLGGSHILVSYPEPLPVSSDSPGTLYASEILLGAEPEGSMLEPVLTRHQGRVTRHIKCDGFVLLALQCARPLVGALGPKYRANCGRRTSRAFSRGAGGL